MAIKKLIKNCYQKYIYRNKIIQFHGAEIAIESVLEGANRVGSGTEFTGYMGYGSYIGRHCNINAKIGKYCSIADNVTVAYGDHPTRKYVSTSPSFLSPSGKQNGITYVKEERFQNLKLADDKYPVVIGNDVWVATGVILLGGITIGDGAIIAAGAVVNKDVAPYSIIGGVPGKLIRNRFSEDEIDFLLKLEWWNKPFDWINAYSRYFDDIASLRHAIESERCTL
jgi:acetyltransferase-like isoleucine patch superfamily enzyme